ncbi:MAG: lamin tail domain-containing protein [Candidatus Cloacimonetes bacterium]|nr:lamin tail domain-containing protein [Candidatus Cloacimonadota bacterium]
MEHKTFGARTGHVTHILCAVILLLPIAWLHSSVVINEVCYDPPGADAQQEWIELYNPSNQTIELTGCKIYSCGAEWSLGFVFPYYLLRPKHFVLVGGEGMTNAQFYTDFVFQNGGSASDAIRFVNADSTYTDTVIYDEPNSNLITDDYGTEAFSLAPDAPEGCSLARAIDGLDTNMCENDFIIEQNPTPNSPNRVYTDYALYSPQLMQELPQKILSVGIRNLGSYYYPYPAQFSVYASETMIHQEDIVPLVASDSIRVQFVLPDDAYLLRMTLELENDVNLENNVSYYSIEGNGSPPTFSEIFPAPLPGKQEWLEVYSAPINHKGDYFIQDEAGAYISFNLPPVSGYYVICTNKDDFVAEYPQCPASSVLESSTWTALNNDGDVLYLYEGEQILDTISYESSIQGKSLLKLNSQDEQTEWRWGSPSPGEANDAHTQDLPEHTERLKLLGSPCDPRFGEQLTLSYNLPDISNRINLRIYDLNGRLVVNLADNLLVTDRGVIHWNGRHNSGKLAQRGLYILLWESVPESGSKVYRKQLTAVIK